MIYQDGSKCPACSTGSLESVEKRLEFEYKGVKITFYNKTVYCCNICPEEFLNGIDSQEIERLLIKDRRRIDNQ